MLELSFLLVHKALANVDTFVDNSISCVFNSSFFILGQRFVMGNIQMSLLRCLLSTSLPNVRSKCLTASSKHNMSACVMSHKLCATCTINRTCNLEASNIGLIRNILVGLVHNDLAYFNAVDNFKFTEAFNIQETSVVHLSTGSRIKQTLV
jgi:hypothetical protein